MICMEVDGVKRGLFEIGIPAFLIALWMILLMIR